MNLKNRISDYRISEGISQKLLAKMIGVSKNAVSDWERNLYQPSVANSLKLLAIFDLTDINKLFYWVPGPEDAYMLFYENGRYSNFDISDFVSEKYINSHLGGF